MIPAIGYRFLRWNAVLCFWFAYVVTRPLGASIADGLGKPKTSSGLGLGDGWVALVFGALIFGMVALLAIVGTDVHKRRRPKPNRHDEQAYSSLLLAIEVIGGSIPADRRVAATWWWPPPL